jgi:hypothetical protein
MKSGPYTSVAAVVLLAGIAAAGLAFKEGEGGPEAGAAT